MKVRYNKGMGFPVEISDGKTATCISLDTAKKLQASLLAVIKQAEMPEEEMSEFEKEYCRLYKEGYADGQAGSEQLSDAVLKASASELLSLAREQIIKDGYVIEKKAFLDAVEKVAPEVMKEVSENVDKTNEELTEFEKELESFYNHHLQVCTYDNQGTVEDSLHGGASKLLAIARKDLCDQIVGHTKEAYENGKAEALKDLPRWEKYPHNAGEEPLVNGILQEDGSYKWRLYLNGYKIEISDLEKLPGFKEDEK